MGPQLYRCGNDDAAGMAEYIYELQWGRNFIVAETGDGSPDGVFPGLASMGPQLYRCGNDDAAGMAEYIYELQWGRNFIVAETLTWQHGHLSYLAASMGPQLYRCGNGARLEGYGPGCLASMGPQLYRCGNAYTGATATVCRGSASMGPQLYRCGNNSGRNRGITSIFMLQWGRNFIVAETGRVWKDTVLDVWLQWGRNFIVAET